MNVHLSFFVNEKYSILEPMKKILHLELIKRSGNERN